MSEGVEDNKTIDCVLNYVVCLLTKEEEMKWRKGSSYRLLLHGCTVIVVYYLL